MAVHDEVEITFHADLDLDLPRVLAQVEADIQDMWAQPAAEPFTLEATYFDTVDLRLARAALTLRRRVGGDDQGWHLKIPAGDDTRAEKHLPLSRARKSVPAALRRMVRARSMGEPLGEVARIETQRTAYLLVDRDGSPLLEVVDDTVIGCRLGEVADAEGEEPQKWREIEVEVKEGSAEGLAQVAASMRHAGLHDATGAGRSKVLRVLDLQPEPEPEAISDRSSAGDVAMADVAEQVEQIRVFDPQVRLDRPDSVHKMRVATRRLRSTLKTFRPVFDTVVTEPLRSEIAWLAEHLGRARDAEVLRERLLSPVGQIPAVGGDGPSSEHAAQRLQETYDAQRDCLVEQLNSERYHTLVESLVALVKRPPLTDQAFRSAHEVLPRRVRKAYRAVERSVRAVDQCPAETRDRALHQARKSAKRARYAAECVVPTFGNGAGSFAAAMEKIQQELGEHQDTVMVRSLLERWAASESSGVRAFAYGRRYAAEEEASTESEVRFARAWRLAQKKKLRRWLKQA